jgi:hypothetical protein
LYFSAIILGVSSTLVHVSRVDPLPSLATGSCRELEMRNTESAWSLFKCYL